MNDIHVYFIRTYEKHISHNYYCQTMAHEVCDVSSIAFASLFIDIFPNSIAFAPLLLVLLLLFIYLLVFFLVICFSFIFQCFLKLYYYCSFCSLVFILVLLFLLFYFLVFLFDLPFFQIGTTLLLLCVGVEKLKVLSNSNSNFIFYFFSNSI